MAGSVSARELGSAEPLPNQASGPPLGEAMGQIEAVLASLVESWNRHDMVAYAKHFTENADFVNVIGVHWRGRQEIQERHIWLHQTIMRNGQLGMLSHSIRFLTPETALAHAYWEQQGHEERPGWNVGEIRKGILTLVLLRQADTWRVTAAHNTDTLQNLGKEESR